MEEMHAARCAAALVAGALLAAPGMADQPWADALVSYDPGADPDPGYQDPANALGEPTRFTGELAGFPGAVTPFNPAFGTDELVSVGFGGHLILSFDEPVTNDALNPFGVDLLLFANAGFIDVDFPNGVVGGVFGVDGGTVEISADGEVWTAVDVVPDGLFPTLGYLDLASPYEMAPGAVESDFTRPVDPSLDFDGAAWEEILSAYDGSGGGVGVDIGAYGLDAISFVRITNLTDDGLAPDIDALADVAPIPAPGGLVVFAALAGFAVRRRSHVPCKR